MTQNETILLHLQMIGPITQKIATEKYGIMRLASRVWDISKHAPVRSRWIRVPSRYGEAKVKEYFLPEGERDDSKPRCLC